MEWALSAEGKTIFWLNGMAGTGKSTIARSIAYSLKEREALGASFFFKRGEGDRGNATKLFTTISRQLLLKIPELAPILDEAMRAHPDVATKGLRKQFDMLLLNPLYALQIPSTGVFPIVVIVLDALDECERDDDVRVILDLLSRIRTFPNVRIRVLLTSRPELPIRLGFSKMEAAYDNLVLHEVPEAVTAKDISLYLCHCLSKLREDMDLPDDWPTLDEIEAVTTLSVPLFIFAATVCRILEDPNGDPIDSLTEIVNQGRTGSQLAATYLPVFNRILKTYSRGLTKETQMIEEFREIIGVIVIQESPLPLHALSQLLDLPERLLRVRLNVLRSVIYIPEDESMPIRPFHLSFKDFLLDPETRSITSFWIDEGATHERLAARCLAKCTNLKRNICGLSDPATQRKDLDPDKIKKDIPLDLQYACRFWVTHVAHSRDQTHLIAQAATFIEKSFLYWMEAMSIIGLAFDLVEILDLLELAIENQTRSDLNIPSLPILSELKRFVIKNWQICDLSPLQLYLSGLTFVPETSAIRSLFKNEFPGNAITGVQKSWSLTQKLEDHSGSISSLAFSNDGRLLASASFDTTIKLWNAKTGALKQTVETLGEATSLSFSPDGMLLAFCDFSWTDASPKSHTENKKVVFLLNTATGNVEEIPEMFNSNVEQALFFPSADKIAWSSSRTITIWRTWKSGIEVTLWGEYTGALAISRCGEVLAIACANRTVEIWDAYPWRLQDTTDELPFLVEWMKFSPDRESLVMGTSKSQRLLEWHFTTRQSDEPFGIIATSPPFDYSYNKQLASSGRGQVVIRQMPKNPNIVDVRNLQGHSRSVTALTFSRSGETLATGSSDKSIVVWDTSMLNASESESNTTVTTVAVSPNGLFSATAFSNGSFTIWDLKKSERSPKTLYAERRDHLAIKSLEFIPNSTFLASVSMESIKLWNLSTGKLQATLVLGIREYVLSLKSTNSRGKLPEFLYISYGGGHVQIRKWDANTGKLSEGFHICHLLHGCSVAKPPKNVSEAAVAAISPKADRLAVGRLNKLVTIELPNTTDSKELFVRNRGANHFTSALEYSDDGTLLAAATSIAAFGGDVRVELWDVTTGSLLHILRGSGGMKRFLLFSGNDSYLHTHVGTLHLEKWRGPSHNTPVKTGFSMYDGKWVALDGQRHMWLPFEYRPVYVATRNGTLAIGSSSGFLILRP